METQQGVNFFFAIIAIILGGRLFKHFDFQNLTFEKPWMDTIYLIGFVCAITALVRNYKIKKAGNLVDNSKNDE